jgi:hypothetical protein
MRIALLLLALVAQEDRHAQAAARVKLPDEPALREWTGRGDRYRRIVALVTDRKHWAAAFRAIDEKLGLFTADCDVRVSIEDVKEAWPAKGGGRDGKGVVRFNIKPLVTYLAKLDEFAMLEKEGKAIAWVVPPTPLEGIVVHELAHVFCGATADKWLTEGIASYVAGEVTLLYAFNHRKSRVESLDRNMPDADAYARGMSFFQWMEEKFGRDKVREFADRVVRKGEPAKDAAAAVTGLVWERILLDERAWSADYIARFKPSR